MNSSHVNTKQNFSRLVILISLVIACIFAYKTYYINYWPTDSWGPYRPTAARLFTLNSLSEMHKNQSNEFTSLNMRAKETLILGIAIMQKVLNDTKSLYPNVLLLIIATCISSILLYFIFKRIFDPPTGALAFFLFTTSFWPYMYVLLGAHQPLALMNFLLTLYLLQIHHKNKLILLLSGIFLGLMLFSSPTAAVYTPYFLLLFLIPKTKVPLQNKQWLSILQKLLLFLGGFVLTFLLFTWPNPIDSINQFIKFLALNHSRNHFVNYHNLIVSELPEHVQSLTASNPFRGAGWVWIGHYFFRIMPVMFTAYIVSILYLLKESRYKSSLLFIIIISCSTPLAVETIEAAQFGRNYFSWIFGIIFLICCAFHHIKTNTTLFTQKTPKTIIQFLLIIFVISHFSFNIYTFFHDVYPARLFTTHIHRWLVDNNIKNLYIHKNSSRNQFTADVLNNPKHHHQIQFTEINTIQDAKEGYILIPPFSGKTIWYNCVANDYAGDPFLSRLFDSRHINSYAAASFKTLGSSRIWVQEEEICTYRDLISKKISDLDRKRAQAYILDAQSLHHK